MNTLTLADGRALAYRETGHGRPLLLLHGWSLSSAAFSELLTELGREFRVIAPDLRGHGFSAAAQGCGLDDFAADLHALITAMDLDRLALGGWSLGGQVALRLAQALPERIERLLLIATTPRFVSAEDWPHGLPVGQVRSLGRNLQRAFEKTLGEFFNLLFGADEISSDRYRQILGFAVRAGRLPHPDTALGALDTLRDVDLRGELTAIGCPTLVLHGREDRIIPPGAGRFVAQAIAGARWCEMPGVGHAPFFSRPAQTLDLFREFLS
ncbi:alpha/beta fold hydrolase [Geoalkalibacter halelectricus]|uniref:Alpha/beta fold hydrolase n=1 Tax=Geoalkalibacter halelectricus TaxID=2847045 RepID=A0ABY5ZQV2_9BACT|nr:alpha/beta fold hydrolase [Geoalkalibacter halelectricus]MDO3379235.1 alpha/beta fold hydrolase [Geoalkalibacter halelectricus]UWZ80993.1 alpha/beta fold hydrolase [Geoalkalibacter halelectricus]